jgi:2-oxo-3-hexenedioate decarboxylase
MRQMGVDEVIWGRLTDAMRVDEGGELPFDRFVHPRAEPEIAFRLSRTPAPEESSAELLTAIDAVAPAIEIIDSRYENFRFSLTDVIADNASSAAFVVGAWRPFSGSVNDLAVELEIDGQVAETGSTAAILDDPLRSLEAAVRLTARYGVRLEPGHVVLAGAATAAVHLTPGAQVKATVEGLGPVGFSVAGVADVAADRS